LECTKAIFSTKGSGILVKVKGMEFNNNKNDINERRFMQPLTPKCKIDIDCFILFSFWQNDNSVMTTCTGRFKKRFIITECMKRLAIGQKQLRLCVSLEMFIMPPVPTESSYVHNAGSVLCVERNFGGMSC
jgi:hypothetical protein